MKVYDDELRPTGILVAVEAVGILVIFIASLLFINAQ